MVSTPIGENVGTNRVFKDCLLVVCCKTMCAKFFELPMHDFEVILGMDWLLSYDCIDCRSRFMRFYFPNEKDLV